MNTGSAGYARSLVCCYSALLWLAISVAHAGVVDAPGEDLEVSLVTYGPGAIYWERFGHDAIRIRDRTTGESEDFNYGVFDFEGSIFIFNFARGHMRYMIEADPSDIDQQDYVDAGRSVPPATSRSLGRAGGRTYVRSCSGTCGQKT